MSAVIPIGAAPAPTSSLSAPPPTIEGLVALLPEPVVLVEADGRIRHANPAFADAAGRSGAELAGRPLAELFAGPAATLETYLRRCAGTLQPIPGGLPLCRDDGSLLRLRCEGAAVRGETGASGVVMLRCRARREAAPGFAVLTEQVQTLSREVLRRRRTEAELRQSEERLYLAIALARLGTWDLDLASGTMVLSDRCRELRGLPPDGPVNRADFEATVHPGDEERRAAALHRVLTSPGPADYVVEYRVIRRCDGAERWVAETGRTALEDGVPVSLFGTTLDITEQRRAAEHQRLLINELNHRVKNSLATVQSIATQTARYTPAPDAFRQAFTSRLMALSQAHNLLTETQWRGTDLRKLIELELAPYEPVGSSRVRLSGPPVRIGPKAVVAFGLAIHELATNAAKYGALSVPQGRVSVEWSFESGEDGRRLAMLWREQDGPPVAPPTRRGFGSRVIEQGLAYDLNGRVQLDFAPDGVRCAMTVPQRALEQDGHG